MKSKVYLLLCVIFILVLLPLNIVNCQTGNLITNPGFEDVTDGLPSGWYTDAYLNSADCVEFLVEEDGHDGGKCMSIINTKENDSRVCQDIEIIPGSVYRISYWLKVDDIASGTGGANITLANGIYYSQNITSTDSQWRYFEHYIQTDAQGDKLLRFWLRLGGYGATTSGRVSFDDVAVELVEDPGSELNIEQCIHDESKDNLTGDQQGNGESAAASNKGSPLRAVLYLLSGAIAVIIVLSAEKKLIRDEQKHKNSKYHDNGDNGNQSNDSQSDSGSGRYESYSQGDNQNSNQHGRYQSDKNISGRYEGYSQGDNKSSHNEGFGYKGNTQQNKKRNTKFAFAASQSHTRASTPISKIKFDRRDYIIMAIVTALYLVISVLNLGSLSVPETSWTPSRSGESFTIDFGREIELDRVYYYSGLGQKRPDKGKLLIQCINSEGSASGFADDNLTSGSGVNDSGSESDAVTPSIDKDYYDIFKWKYVEVNGVKTRFVRFAVDTPGGTLNEIAFFENGSTKPLSNFTIADDTTDTADQGKVINLFDEPEKVDYSHSYLSGMIFDEIYHARTAYEYINGMDVTEWTHPPLGKLFISLGILIFGMNPFGWRIIGTLFGAAMIPVMYIFGKKLFSRRFYAFCAAFLMMFDFMHFGLTRIATIDVYATFFVILMYYFMYCYYADKSYTLGFKQSLRPLLLCGVCFGLGAASKWIGLYAGGGLAVLFFSLKYSEYKDYNKLCSHSKATYSPSKADHGWCKDFIPIYLVRTMLYCVLYFVIMPLCIYVLSYIPGIISGSYKSGISYIIQNQSSMLRYHGTDVLSATHPFSSYWWQWPIMSRPLETYAGTDLPAGLSSTMTIMGNPAIWWLGIIAVVLSLFLAIRKRDRKMTVLFVAIAFQYLPWVGITRITFIYHFFSTVPFLILCIVYIIKQFIESYPKLKFVVCIYLGIVLLLFIMFYPVLSGMPVSRGYVETFLLWFAGSWVF